jgi:phage recombination protein Bet
MNERLPVITSTRIPYHPIVQERYGIAAEHWRALVDAVFPAAKTIEGIMLALSYCKARKLDVFKRPVHIIPIWNSALRREIETVWSGIGELRTTAFRTGQYAGADAATFGPDISETFRGEVGRGDQRRTAEETVTFPEWCQVSVYRLDRNGQPRRWPGPRVYWLETYQSQGRSTVPNEMWGRRPRGQLEKCAEAAALRKAFPEEIGEQFIGDEIRSMRDITPPPAQPESVDSETGEVFSDPMDRLVAEANGNGDASQGAPEPAQTPRPVESPPTTGSLHVGDSRRGRRSYGAIQRDVLAAIESAQAPADLDRVKDSADYSRLKDGALRDAVDLAIKSKLVKLSKSDIDRMDEIYRNPALQEGLSEIDPDDTEEAVADLELEPEIELEQRFQLVKPNGEPIKSPRTATEALALFDNWKAAGAKAAQIIEHNAPLIEILKTLPGEIGERARNL